MDKETKISPTRRKHGLIACAYGLVLGIYFGLVIGFRINPDFLDRKRELLYFILVVAFAVGLHANRKLSGPTAWMAYLACCSAFIASAVLFDRANIIELPPVDLALQAFYLFGLLMALGPVAHGIGWAVRKFILPPEATTKRWLKAWLPWLPALVMLAMTLHTVEHVMNYGGIRVDRRDMRQRTERLHGMIISLASGGIQTSMEDSPLRLTLALPKNHFNQMEEAMAVVVFENRGDTQASLSFHGPLKQLVVVRDENGERIPTKQKGSAHAKVTTTAVYRYPPIPAGDRRGYLLPLHQWFRFEIGKTYTIRLRWKQTQGEPMAFTVGPKPKSDSRPKR